MLEIKNLHVDVDGKEILKGLDLDRQRRARCTPSWGRTAPARARSPTCWPAATATRSPRAACPIEGKDLLALEPEERAREGVFLAFQYPVEIPGVTNTYFLQPALNADPQGARRARARRVRVPEAGAGED